MQFFISRALMDTRNMPCLDNVTYYQEEVPDEPGFLFGTISDMRKELQAQKVFYNLKVSDYLGAMHKYCLNYSNSYFKQVCQLEQTDIGKFVKSNSGCKVITGDILTREGFSFIKDNYPDDEMLFIAPYKKILKEYRFWVIDEEIVTYSHYSWDRNHDYQSVPENVINFAGGCAKQWSGDLSYTMDIGIALHMNSKQQIENQIGIIEYNCLSTSGLYNANIEKLIQAVEKVYKGAN